VDQELVKWILGGVGTAVIPFSSWAWKQRQAGLERERAKDARIAELTVENTTLKVEIAIAETKLAGYGKSAPELTDQIDALTERVARLLYKAEPSDERSTNHQVPDVPWPYPRNRPSAPRRSQR
jgi:hypothetical protein